MRRPFIWDDWNEDHIGKHNVSRGEAQYVIERRQPPYPRDIGDGKFVVHGQTAAGRYLQVIYSLRSVSEIDYESMTIDDIIAVADDDRPSYYVIHARELTPRERQLIRQKRS